MFDYLIQNGQLIDGTAAPAVRADIAITDGKIAAVGDLKDASAGTVLDAAGKYVTPGFIDIHRHADAALFRPHFGELELKQGLTTIVNGNCGLSVTPCGGRFQKEIEAYLTPVTGALPDGADFSSLAAYLRAAKKTPSPIHTAMLAGSGTIRACAAGFGTPELDAAQMAEIHRLIEQELAAGALGVSLGLGYAPDCFYSTETLIEALRPLQDSGIPITVHMRQEGGGVCQSVEEMLLVARELRIPLHISHLKAMGRDNWGKKIPQALSMLQRAKDEGMDVGCDVYPYTAGSTQLLHILPPEFLEGGMDAVVRRLADPAQRQTLAHRIEDGGGFDDIAKLAGWDGIFLSSLHCPEDEQFLGKSIAEEAAMEHKSPLDSCCDLLIREHCQVTMIDFMAAEEDIAAILRSPLSCLISDATYPTEGMPHPRVYGSCTRLLQHFVGEKGVLSLEEGVRKLTLEPARALRLPGKGVIAEGADADLCVFDPAALSERGTYQQPCRTAEGMTAVFVGGQLAVENGQLTGVKNGRIIRR